MDAISEVEHYLLDITYQDFENNSEKRFAIIKQIEIVGEACNHISDGLNNKIDASRSDRDRSGLSMTGIRYQ